jgi:O-antigen/teichoic acid export membrane protein
MKLSIKNTSLKNNILRVLSANFWVALIGFASSFVFPRILTIDDFALYHTFTLYLTYITILHLGFPSGLVIKYAGKNYEDIDEKQYKTEVYIIGIILGSFTILFFLLSLFLHNKMIVYIALAIIPYDLVGSYKALLQAWSNFKKFSILSTLVATLIPVLAFLWYVLRGTLPGNVYICIYLTIYWCVSFFVIMEILKKIRGAQARPILSRENWETEKNGIILVLGNYINILFVSADKQFVKWFFDNSRFAYYSFGMSMQALMTVFITSIAQPLFPAMAQGKFRKGDYNQIKELLIIFGSLSGCAYFATAIIVRNFIPKYVESLSVVGIYFVVFPAMAVVNCLYINLYKIMNLMKKYIITLVGILVTAVILNSIAVKVYPFYTGISIATTITYYIWFLIGFKQFVFLKLKFSDVAYLVIYTMGFFLITRNVDNYLGIPVYLLFIAGLVSLFYRKDLKTILGFVRR